MSIQGRATQLTHRGVLGAFIVAERKQQGAASDLFKLAQRCQNMIEFTRLCEEAEDFYLSDDAGQMRVQELPRKYIQAKSDIRGAFKAGLDLTRIKSYSAMKRDKGDANKAARQEPTTPNAETLVSDGGTDNDVVIVVADESQQRQAPGQRRYSGPRKERDVQPELTMVEALERGLVLDAKTNVLMPEDMRPLVVALNKLPEMARARLIKRFTKEAHDALSQEGTVRVNGGRRVIQVS